MTLDGALSAAATLIAGAFCISTTDRWLRRRRAHDAAWSISLALFALGSGALWWAEARGWSTASFRVFYFAGAIANVPWLASGTVHLLVGDPIARRVRNALVFFTGLAAGVMLVAPTSAPIVPDELPKGSEVFGAGPRALAAVGSGVAALVIIVGALWSIGRVWRGRIPALGAASRQVADARRLVAANSLIAVGTLVLSASGSLAGRLGEDRAFAVTLLVGVCVLFAGFLVTSTRRVGSQRAAQQFAELVVG